ncbi:uncharacterized protein [Rutidosis leptorrhynchoides]|uniref:uncharacterized protein n=1 Tax=Rutidosis leptorrhynchoides TaxID=125765 RepID=UPI003A9A3CD5
MSKRGFDWQLVVECGWDIEKTNIPFRKLFVKDIGDGASTSFWNDVWIGEVALKDRFKRLARLETNLEATVRDRLQYDGSKCIGVWSWARSSSGRANGELENLNELLVGAVINPLKQDMWRWGAANNGKFTTKSLRKFIDEKMIPRGNGNIETLRNNLVPKKIEVFVWRARRKRLPNLIELDKRGIDLNTVRCPLCDDDIESIDHSLFLCKHVMEVWNKVFEWWGLEKLDPCNLGDPLADTGQANSTFGKDIWQTVIWSSSYLIWKNRNQKFFSNKSWNAPVALNEIQVKSYE